MPDVPQGAADEFSQAIARAIEDAKAAAGLTTRDLIKRSGLSANYYYRRARGELPFTTNDMSALATACGVTVGDLWSRAQESLTPKVKSPEQVVAERVHKLLAVAQAQFPKLDVQGALLASDVAKESHLTLQRWQAVLAGEHSDITAEQLVAIATFFGVDESYLTQLELSGTIDDIDARLDVQQAFAQTEARGASSRGVAGASPASLRALARAIRESKRAEE